MTSSRESTLDADGIPTGRIPDIFLGGFPKCGTSSLHAVLNLHTDISEAVWRDPEIDSIKYRAPKEHYFFSKIGNFEQGIEWYSNHFRTDRTHAVDSTPTYFCEPIALERIKAVAPNSKFIMMLREPVARAFSAWNHWHQLAAEERWPMAVPNGTFEDNLAFEMNDIQIDTPKEGFLGQSTYIAHLKNFEKYFSREQLFVGFSAEFRLDFYGFLKRLQDFLGVTPLEFPFREYNKREYTVSPLSNETRLHLREFFEPFDRELEEYLGRKCPWNIGG